MEEEGRRGFGGGGALLELTNEETDSLDVVRSATGFRGGGGAALPCVLVVNPDDSASASVFALRRVGDVDLCSVSESRSIRFSTDLVAFRGGRLGRYSG